MRLRLRQPRYRRYAAVRIVMAAEQHTSLTIAGHLGHGRTGEYANIR
jgi:hypothetical protein